MKQQTKGTSSDTSNRDRAHCKTGSIIEKIEQLIYASYQRRFGSRLLTRTSGIVKPLHATLGAQSPRRRRDGIVGAAGTNQPVGIGQHPPLSETLIMSATKEKIFHASVRKRNKPQENRNVKHAATKSNYSNVMGVTAVSSRPYAYNHKHVHQSRTKLEKINATEKTRQVETA